MTKKVNGNTKLSYTDLLNQRDVLLEAAQVIFKKFYLNYQSTSDEDAERILKNAIELTMGFNNYIDWVTEAMNECVEQMKRSCGIGMH